MAEKKSSGRKYGRKASKKVAHAMHEYKHGELKAGSGHHPKAKSRKQAIAIGLSEARAEGDKVPSKKSSSSSSRSKSSHKRGSTAHHRSTSSRRKHSSSSKSHS
jgi:hypothetical protein